MLGNRSEMLELADILRQDRPLYARGVAMLKVILTDGNGLHRPARRRPRPPAASRSRQPEQLTRRYNTILARCTVRNGAVSRPCDRFKFTTLLVGQLDHIRAVAARATGFAAGDIEFASALTTATT